MRVHEDQGMATKVLPNPHKPGSNAKRTEKPDTLESRYAEVAERIAAAAAKSRRQASDIILVAVTKNAEPEQIKELLRLGHRDFGENRVQQSMHHAVLLQHS